MNKVANGWMDGLMDVQIDGLMDGQVDGFLKQERDFANTTVWLNKEYDYLNPLHLKCHLKNKTNPQLFETELEQN